MTMFSVGKELVSYCGKCKLSLGHIIASMQGDKVDKVVCNTCKATHKHKDAAKPKPRKMVLGSKSKSRTHSDDIWKSAVEKASQFLPYTPQSHFKLGDAVDHSKFGQGLVEKLIDADKIEVLFREGYKTLVHGK
jgi:hypothetical protein